MRCVAREQWLAELDEPFEETGRLINLAIIQFSFKIWRVMRAIFILLSKK